MHRVRAANRALPRLRQAEERHLPFAHQRGHRSDHALDRHRAIDAMLIEQIDMICAQPAQRALHRFSNMLRSAVQARERALIAEAESELGGDHHAIALPGQRARQQLLVGVGTVRFGRVEERHAELQRAMERGDGFALVSLLGRAVREAHPHAAEPDRRDLQIA
jgi:hypothetical protein